MATQTLGLLSISDNRNARPFYSRYVTNWDKNLAGYIPFEDEDLTGFGSESVESQLVDLPGTDNMENLDRKGGVISLNMKHSDALQAVNPYEITVTITVEIEVD